MSSIHGNPRDAGTVRVLSNEVFVKVAGGTRQQRAFANPIVVLLRLIRGHPIGAGFG